MTNAQKEELFERTTIYKAVFRLSAPTIISSLVMIVYNLADTYYVGLLNSSVQNASIALSAPVLLAFNAINNLFGVGSSSVMSRALGKKDYERVRTCSALGIYSALMCSILISGAYLIFQNQLFVILGADEACTFYLKKYLRWTTFWGASPAILNVVMAYMVRSEGATFHASVGTMSGCLMNIILDPFFVLPMGLNLGIEGAGIATFISNCVACLYFVGYILTQETNLSLNMKHLHFKWNLLSGICWVGIPASIQNILNVFGMTILNNTTAKYGTDVVAAMGIAQKINMIPVYILLGMSQGIMPLIGYTYSNGNFNRLKKMYCFSVLFSIFFSAVMVIVYILNAKTLISVFTTKTSIISYGQYFFRGLCFSLPFLSIDFLTLGVYQSCGKGHMSLFLAILRKMILEIPVIYLLDFYFPIYGVSYAQMIAEIVLATICVTSIMKFFKHL